MERVALVSVRPSVLAAVSSPPFADDQQASHSAYTRRWYNIANIGKRHIEKVVAARVL